jgi:thiamine pyrophosphate-dependent acetolactate synthase large subunit-like protein
VGQGALGAREEVAQLATKLSAPVAKALLGKGVLADDSLYTTGGIGHLGTAPSEVVVDPNEKPALPLDLTAQRLHL